MHFHLPKPLHGWRAFAGEVGIIVIGVLIALGAEQVVEAAHWRRSVAEAKESLDAELGDAKMSSIELIQDQACTDRRLDRLDALVDRGTVPVDMHVQLFGLRKWSTSTWEAATSSGAVAHMSLDDRNRYAGIFGLVRVLGGLATKAYEASSDLSSLDRHNKLTDVSRDRLDADLAKLRKLNFMLGLGSRQFLEGTRALNLHILGDAQAQLSRERAYNQRCPMPDSPAAAA